MLGLLTNRWVLGGLAGLVMLGFSYWKGYTYGKEVIQKDWDAAKVVWEREIYVAQREARQTERQMQEEADTLRKEKQDAIQNLNRRHAAIVDSLRNRTNRPQTNGVPGDSRPAEGERGCTGAELHRQDAEFLIGEAARADEIRIELEACYVQYDKIRSLYNK